MEISNPRRILAVSLEGSAQHLSRAVKDLTGSSPEAAATTLAGSTHDLELTTAYYTATVPVWLDLITAPSEWASSFLSDEAKEVLAVLGAVVLVFAIPGTKPTSFTAEDEAPNLIRQVGKVVQHGLGGWEWDGVRLAIGIGEGDVEEWDELCTEAGLEFVQLGGTQHGRNEYGEKTGIERVKEALESNDWDQLNEPSFSDFEDAESNEEEDGALDFDPESLDFGVDRTDFEGLRMAIWETGHSQDALEDANRDHPKPAPVSEPTNAIGSDAEGKQIELGELKPDDENLEIDNLGDEDVAKVERMMKKLLAARELGEGMHEAQRKRLAAKAVQDVMREL